MGGKGALNYLPIVPKASIYVPKVMGKPVMGGAFLLFSGVTKEGNQNIKEAIRNEFV